MKVSGLPLDFTLNLTTSLPSSCAQLTASLCVPFLLFSFSSPALPCLLCYPTPSLYDPRAAPTGPTIDDNLTIHLDSLSSSCHSNVQWA